MLFTPFTAHRQLAFIDVETSGLSPRSDRIIEIAIVKLDGNLEPYVAFETLINPCAPIENTLAHGIDDGMVAAAPTFEEVVGQIADHLQGCTLVGHNVGLEVRFLITEIERSGFAQALHAGDGRGLSSMCTLSMARTHYSGVREFGLEKLCDRLGVVLAHPHRAANACVGTARLFLGICREQGLPLDRALESALGDNLPFPALDVAEEFHVSPLRRTTGVRRPSSIPLPPARPAPYAHSAALYIEVLDRCLADGVLTEEKRDELDALAWEWEIDSRGVEDCHRRYLAWLVDEVLDEEGTTALGRDDLIRVARVLDLDGELRSIIAARKGSRRASWAGLRRCAARKARQRVLRCEEVALVGRLDGPAGTGTSPEQAAEIAAEHGVTVTSDLSPETGVVVLGGSAFAPADIERFAAGKRLVVPESVFWRDLGAA